jgi:hypothetical protein
MKVKELIEKLQEFNGDDEVVVQKCDGIGDLRTDAVGGYAVNHEVVTVHRGHIQSVAIIGIGETQEKREARED